MSFIRTKEIPVGSGNYYEYEVENIRIGSKVKQKHIRYIGKLGTTQLNISSSHSPKLGTTQNQINTSLELVTTQKNDSRKKLITKIKKAKDASEKTKIWEDADLLRDESEKLVSDMILSLPKGHYKLHDRTYGTNIQDKIYELYGLMPSVFVNERIMLGLQVLYPEKVYASFTLGLDAIQIK